MSRKSKNSNKKMREFEKQSHELGLKYAKTTFIRYMSAFLLVYSIYWFYLALLTKPILAVVPFIFFAAYLICMVDQYASLHNHKQKQFNWTLNVMKITLILDVLMIIVVIIDYKMLFPYYSKFYYPIITFAIGMIIKLFVIRKIIRLNNEK